MPFKCSECGFCECSGCAHTIRDNICQGCRSRENVSGAVNNITRENILNAIHNLRKGSSPGIDCISPEHLIYAKSTKLADLLANIYTIMIRSSTIPEIFQKSLIIPILKKSTLDPNIPSNFRPITLSSIHTKLVEYILMPEDNAHKNQFGFRKQRGTMFATSVLNDIAAYTMAKNSALYVCSLDAEKCFDSIWHCGLFYKLMHIIPDAQWLFLYNWYSKTYVQVRWESHLSKEFHITKGMKQGSLISPRLFNIFIDDLLKNLKSMNPGVRIHNFHINSFAYADDINLLSTTSIGLQNLIDKCDHYARMWKMKFNPLKTNIVCIGKQPHITPPEWVIGNAKVSLSDNTDILGVAFNSSLESTMHINNRVRKCQQGTFAMSAMGLSYPGLNSDVKAFLWKSISSPLLVYGMESLSLSNSDLKLLKTTQGNIIKRIMGLNKRSHHTKLLKALKVPPIEEVIKKNSLGLYKNIFKTDTPSRELQSILLARYITKGSIIKGTLLERIVKFGVQPLDILFDKNPVMHAECDINTDDDGLTDSLRYLLYHEDYNKPWSQQHVLATLLTKAF